MSLDRTTTYGIICLGGSLKDLAQIGAPATADPDKVGKNKIM